MTAATLVLLLAVLASACAASPERKRGEELTIDAAYVEFDCAALVEESTRLDAEIVRAQAIVDSPTQWIPIINIFTLTARAAAINDLFDAKARRSGVDRAQARLACPVDGPGAAQPVRELIRRNAS